ncbi:hypothetical protein F4604DRAFT_1930073 [Suillus subluteus]|nr:hypothetical protein F4604DRAFT_1930073 [Suillus subluteus]
MPYPPQTLFQNDETPPTSPLHSPKSSPLFPKADCTEAFTHIYHDSPQSSSPPSSLCPSSPQGTHNVIPNISKDSNEVLAASVSSSGHHDFSHADRASSPMKRREPGQRHSRQISQSSYHPYFRKTPPTPQAERKIASVMGRLASSTDSEYDGETIHRIFSQGLQQMSTEGVRRAAYYKEAELEYHRHLSMTLTWEAEKLSRLKHFLDGKQQVQEDKTTQAFEEAALFTCMVVDRDSERASQDVAFITAVQKNEVKRITRLNAELDELDALLPLDPSASDFDDADTHSIGDPHRSDHSYVGDPPEDGLVMVRE